MEKIGIGVFAISSILGMLTGRINYQYQILKSQEIKEKELIILKKDEEEKKDEILPIWKTSRFQLENQILEADKKAKWIFNLSIALIVIGFFGICFSIYFAINNSNFNVALITISGAVITNFLGGTVMLMYKNSLLQLNKNIEILEKVNSVGMSLKILDTIKNNNRECSKTKLEIAKKLIK